MLNRAREGVKIRGPTPCSGPVSFAHPLSSLHRDGAVHASVERALVIERSSSRECSCAGSANHVAAVPGIAWRKEHVVEDRAVERPGHLTPDRDCDARWVEGE